MGKRQRGFKDNDFRSYMSRKIELQRKQFGVVLPPEIRTESATDAHCDKEINNGGKSSAESSKHNVEKSYGVLDVVNRLKRRHSKPIHGKISISNSSNNEEKVLISSEKKRHDLFFTGVVILVNGYTNPDASTLMRMMHKNGGDLEKYETNRVTHIIAEHLSTAKALIYRKRKNPTPVCSPKWISDCVELGKLIPHADYIIKEVRNMNVGGGIKSFLSAANSSAHPKSPPSHTSKDDVVITSSDQSSKAKTNISTNQKGVVRFSEPVRVDYFDEAVSFSSSRTKSQFAGQTLRINGYDSTAKVNKKVVEGESETLKLCSEEEDVTDTTSLQESASSSVSSAATKHKIIGTVGTDPNFLQSYFSNSRLSFIGRFKQRIKKGTESNCTNRTLDASSINERMIFHIDMDCFFASVALRNHPEHVNTPVAIGHAHKMNSLSSAKKSTAELSTCNYIARKQGVKKGMWLEQALALCPELIVLPYDYEGYEEVSLLVSEILHKYTEAHSGILEQESCDEFYSQFSVVDLKTKEEVAKYSSSIAENIRGDIFNATQCTASVGVGPNKFLAKLATDKAKPNGSYVIQNWEKELRDLKLRDLPGIGRKLQDKLNCHNLVMVQDVWDLGNDAESDLTKIIGPGIAKKVLQFSRGEDARPVSGGVRRTVGAECNYGVRFDGPYGVDHMISGLADEVQKRMDHLDLKGSQITLKIKRKKENWNVEKFLGHGPCYNLSKSCDLPGRLPTRDSAIFTKYGMKLFVELGVEKDDVKGMGIVISKLDVQENDNAASNLSIWFKSDMKNQKTNDQTVIEILEDNSENNSSTIHSTSNNCELNYGQASSEVSLPSMSQIDWNEVSLLPNDIQKEILQKLESTSNLDDSKQNQASKKSKNKTMSRLSGSSKVANSSSNKNYVPRKKRQKRVLNNDYDEKSRQLSVKHMLRLVDIKAGNSILTDASGESVSLTQLAALPLELQLQVANADTNTEVCDKLIDIEEQNDVVFIGHNLQHDPNENEGQDDCSYPEDDCREDITVINEWMSHCPLPTTEDISRVGEFFELCLTEHRLDEVIIMLRSIRNRDDEWKNHFCHLVSVVSSTYFTYSKRTLDIKWLGLE